MLYNRYTYYKNGKWKVKIGEKEVSQPFVDRLAKYESIGRSPDEIVECLDTLMKYRKICDDYTPESIAHIIKEYNRLKEEEHRQSEFMNYMKKLEAMLPYELKRGITV